MANVLIGVVAVAISAVTAFVVMIAGWLLTGPIAALLSLDGTGRAFDWFLGVYSVLLSLAAGYGYGRLWRPRRAPWEPKPSQSLPPLPCVFIGWSCAAVLFLLGIQALICNPNGTVWYVGDTLFALGTPAFATLGVYLSRLE